MRARGTQARIARARLSSVQPPAPRPSPDGEGSWRTIAIIAIAAAVVGWSAVGAMVLGSFGSAGTSPAPAAGAPLDDTLIDDASLPPDPEVHEAPELEAMLPTEWAGRSLLAESWTGTSMLADDDWSVAMGDFLEEHERSPADLTVAQAYDQLGELDLSIGVFRLEGVDATTLIEGMSAAWRASDDTFQTTEAQVGGKPVVRGEFPEDPLVSYWYAADDVVFDVETSDADLAAAVLAALP